MIGYIDHGKLDEDLTEYCARLIQAINNNQVQLNDDSWKVLYINDSAFRMNVRAMVHNIANIVKDNQQHTGDL